MPRVRSEATRKRDAAYRKEWYAKDPEARRKHWRLWKLKKLEKAAGRPMPTHCESCGRAAVDALHQRLFFDHDHDTDQFRGCICHQCNTVLGLAYDSVDILLKVALYIEKFKGESE